MGTVLFCLPTLLLSTSAWPLIFSSSLGALSRSIRSPRGLIGLVLLLPLRALGPLLTSLLLLLSRLPPPWRRLLLPPLRRLLTGRGVRDLGRPGLPRRLGRGLRLRLLLLLLLLLRLEARLPAPRFSRGGDLPNRRTLRSRDTERLSDDILRLLGGGLRLSLPPRRGGDALRGGGERLRGEKETERWRRLRGGE